MRYLIYNGRIVDGTGRAAFAGSVLTEEERICAIFREKDSAQAVEKLKEDPSVTLVDAEGGYITPGFIDIHRHGDWQALENGDDELLNRQGITSVINGNCGLSAAPQAGAHAQETDHFLRSIIGSMPDTFSPEEDPSASMEAYLSCLRRVKRSVHTGMLVGGGTVRAGVAGYGGAAPDEAQEKEIRNRIERSLEAGALGVSLGMGYAPEFAYDEAGLERVLGVLRGTRIPVTAHIRTEGDGCVEAVLEMIRVCKRLGVPLHLSHMKCIGKRNWRTACRQELEMIRRAREDGMEISLDTYPYVTGATQLVHLIPPRFQSGGTKALLCALEDPDMRRQITRELQIPSGEYDNIVELAGFENIAATSLQTEEFAPFEGMSIAAAAEARGQDPYETLYDLLLAERCEPAMLDTYGCEEDLTDFLKDEACSLISDSIYPERGRRHPRVYDSFVRFLTRYVREKGVFTIEEAVRKMTSVPAAVFHLDKGVLEEGKCADICVFHLENLQSHATFADPERLCTGMDAVFTGGRLCVLKDEWLGAEGGRVLSRKTAG